MIIDLSKKQELVSSDTVGAFPVREDITVLPADDPNKLKLGWKIYESFGSPIQRIIDGEKLTPEQKYLNNE